MSKNYGLSIALTKLKHVVMEQNGKAGKVKGLFIPIEANDLIEGKEGAVYLTATAFINDSVDDYGNIGRVKQKQSKKWADMSDEEKEASKKLPYIGNLKDFSGGGSSDATGDVSGGQVFSADDNLPF